MLSIVKHELMQTLKHFYNVTGIKIVLYDSARNVLVTYPETFNPFCTQIRGVDCLKKRCLDCDNYGFDTCDKTGQPYIYKCHLSITEAIAPIYAGDTKLGYLMFGQVLCEDDIKKARQCAVQTAKKFGLEEDKLISSLDTFTTASTTYLVSALNIMSMCAGYLYTNEIIKNSADALAGRLKEYIGSHITENLDTKLLCNVFYVSKSKLYKTSLSAFGMGITQYIRHERIEKAKKLLSSTSESISAIAVLTGINDTNYFSRIFKESTSLTPRQYRQKHIRGT